MHSSCLSVIVHRDHGVILLPVLFEGAARFVDSFIPRKQHSVVFGDHRICSHVAFFLATRDWRGNGASSGLSPFWQFGDRTDAITVICSFKGKEGLGMTLASGVDNSGYTGPGK